MKREYGAPNNEGGAPGSANGGGGGDGGTSGQGFSVTAISPDDQAVDVERDVPFVITFSAPIDPASVTSSSVQVAGVNGPVAGSLTTDGNTVAFQPERRWHLHSEVKLTLTTELRSEGGDALAESEQSSFWVRDGQFGTPQLLSTRSAVNLTGHSNEAGDTVIAWQNPAGNEVTAVVFHADTAEWTEEAVRSTAEEESRTPEVAINGSGDAILTWNNFESTANFETPNSAGWARYSRLTGWSSASTLDRTGTPGSSVPVVLGNDGVALGVWSRSIQSEYYAWYSWLGQDWSSPQLLDTDASIFRVARVNDEFLVTARRESDQRFGVRSTTAYGEWQTPVTFDHRVVIATSRGEALAAIHGSAVSAAFYKDGIWTEEGIISTGSVAQSVFSRAYLRNGHGMISWFTEGLGVRVRLRSPDGTWSTTYNLGTSSDVFASGIVDAAGNALAYWVIFSDSAYAAKWRRFHPDSGWSATYDLPDVGSYVSVGAEGSLLYVFGGDDQVWYRRFE